MPKRKRETSRPLTAITGAEMATTLITRSEAMRSLGEVVYAVRVGEVVKIGHTADLAQRCWTLRASEVLAFVPGTRADEQALHDRLAAHLHHGREWYYPTPGVVEVVNEMRERLGLQPLAA